MATQSYTDGVTLSGATEWDRWDAAGYAMLSGVAGTNTITATGPASYTYAATRPAVWFIASGTNTGATTINITPSGGAALGAKNVFSGNSACVGGEIVSGALIGVAYDGTQFHIINPITTKGTTSSTLTFDGSGGTTGAVTITMQKTGQFVVMNIPAVTGTSGTGSTTLLSDTAIAAAFRPASTQDAAIVPITNNNAAVATPGAVRVNTNGTINIFRDVAQTAFFNSSTCGIRSNFTFGYFVG